MREDNAAQLLERVAEQQMDVLKELQSQRLELDRQRLLIEAQRQMPLLPKDPWDRIGAIAPILSAVIIACIGAYFTYTYNLQQLKVQEIQTIERFMPHLVGDEKSKRAAILAIGSLGNAQLAAKVASVYASEGTASALQSIADKSESKDKRIVRDALGQTLDALADKYKYENKFDDALDTYKRALAIKEQTFGKDSPELAENLDKLAQMYELHGDHAAASMTLRRASTLRGHGDVARGDDSGAYAHAVSVTTNSDPKKSDNSESPRPAPDVAVGSKANEPEVATEKAKTAPAKQSTEPSSHPNAAHNSDGSSHAGSHSAMAEESRTDI